MLELRKLKKSYKEPSGDELPILDVPHWSVDAGEQVVVVGPSGCGKTTLLHIIAGILRPTSGQVLIDGWDTPILTESERDQFRARRIGYVFQTFNLLPGFTALENVQLGMAFAGRGRDKKRAIDLLERVGLGARLHHKPANNSAFPLRARWRTSRSSFWPTSRPRTSTSATSRSSSICCGTRVATKT